MARGVNGYVTINVGVVNGHSKVSATAALTDDERNRRIRRLRKDGWSYRRIAATMGLSYAAVCQLLDGDEARLPLPPPVLPLPRRLNVVAAVPPPPVVQPMAAEETGSAAPAVSSARIDEMTAQIIVLQQRLDTVLALNEGHRLSLARLERNMVSTLQKEHHALGQRLHSTVKALLERMIPTSLRVWSTASERTPDDQG